MINSYKTLQKIGVMPGMSIAEFGGNRSGHFTLAASKLVGEEGGVFVVDVMKEVLEMLVSRARIAGHANVHPVWGDFSRKGGVSLPESSIDKVLFVHSFGIVQDLGVTMEEVDRVLEAYGELVIIDWRKNAQSPFCRGYRCVTPHQVEADLRRYGFKKATWFQPEQTHWGGVFKRA